MAKEDDLTEKKGEFRDYTNKEDVQYKNKVVFLRKSKNGRHLYAFDNDGALAVAKSIILNVSEVEALIEGKYENIKVSIMEEGKD